MFKTENEKKTYACNPILLIKSWVLGRKLIHDSETPNAVFHIA